jgi:hypothetical protein
MLWSYQAHSAVLLIAPPTIYAASAGVQVPKRTVNAVKLLMVYHYATRFTSDTLNLQVENALVRFTIHPVAKPAEGFVGTFPTSQLL